MSDIEFGMGLGEVAERGFARHESFQPRYGWFRKAYQAVERDPGVFSRADATVRVGVGKNMVRAIRFWGLAAKIIQKRPGAAGYAPAPMGRALFGPDGWDRYAEHPGTLWLLHWLILTPRCLLPVWWVAFHDFPPVEFTGRDLEEAAAARVAATPGWAMPKMSSIHKDVSTLFRTYDASLASRTSDRESRIECPLRQLNLLEEPLSDGRYRFRTGPKASLPSEIVAYAALDYISHIGASGGSIPLNRLAYQPGTPGRAFKLSETDLAVALEPTVEQNRRLRLANRGGAAHLDWSGEPAVIARAVLEEHYYRAWNGPDVDVGQLLESAQRQIRERPLAEILSSVDDPQPMVAARHSAQNDCLRIFSRRYAGGDEEVEPPDPFSYYDGQVLLVVDDHDALPRKKRTPWAAKPVAAALPKDVSDLDAVARETAALQIALQDPMASGDWAARRELRERLARARRYLEHALVAAFGADSCRWVLLKEGGGGAMTLSSGRGSAALSDAADMAYPDAPQVRNEMVNCDVLTSQGKAARKKLMTAMVERGGQPGLGMEGYGPEVAMYKAVLGASGLHRSDSGTFSFRAPTDRTWKPAWRKMTELFQQAGTEPVSLNDVHAVLRSPPIGMKAGVAPVFILAGLLAWPDRVAVCETGFARPLTAQLAERMTRRPDGFRLGPPPPGGMGK